ncbi:MAG: two-component system, chemotaxis family, CheB/CheR fusion protein [Mucilaginibacter sp.]|nr:two-component system, chemotaxis family, CheB/CheR fusion protein [Mucilaginibacter sp.]
MPIPAKDTASPSVEHQFPVVGFGASAGGLEAFKLFSKAIPQKSRMAYVYVLYLYPTDESYLPEILQKFTGIQVHLIADNVQIQPDYIDIMPPDCLPTAVEGVLKMESIACRRITSCANVRIPYHSDYKTFMNYA